MLVQVNWLRHLHFNWNTIYSGHVDLILNGKPVGDAYTRPTGGVKSIRVWVLN